MQQTSRGGVMGRQMYHICHVKRLLLYLAAPGMHPWHTAFHWQLLSPVSMYPRAISFLVPRHHCEKTGHWLTGGQGWSLFHAPNTLSHQAFLPYKRLFVHQNFLALSGKIPLIIKLPLKMPAQKILQVILLQLVIKNMGIVLLFS